MITIHRADARSMPIESGTVQTCVTSPPYWGLRDYGLEPSIWGGGKQRANTSGATRAGRPRSRARTTRAASRSSHAASRARRRPLAST